MALNTKHVYLNKFYAHLKQAVTAGATSISFYPEEITNLMAGWEASTWLYLCIFDSTGNVEIVKMTALSGSTLTVARGQGGTSARAWAAGSLVSCRAFAEHLTRFRQKGVNREGAYNPNDVLTGEYTGEKFYQTGPADAQRRWWINTTGTKWRLLTGEPYTYESQDEYGYWHESWVQHFYDDMVAGPNCHYDAENEWFEWSGPGPYLTGNVAKDWYVGYRPYAVRLTYNTKMEGGSITVYDEYGNGIGAAADEDIETGPGIVEIWLTFADGDLRQNNMISMFGVDETTNIEFLEG